MEKQCNKLYRLLIRFECSHRHSTWRTSVLLAVLVVLLLTFGLGSMAPNPASASGQKNDDQKISDQAALQILALMQEKASRTAAQRKIDSQLLYEIKKRSASAETSETFKSLDTGIEVDNDGQVLV